MKEASPEDLGLSTEKLEKLIEWKMPFGRYKGLLLLELPEPYLMWWVSKGFPEGELGELLELAAVIKGEGLMPLMKPLLNSHSAKPTPKRK